MDDPAIAKSLNVVGDVEHGYIEGYHELRTFEVRWLISAFPCDHATVEFIMYKLLASNCDGLCTTCEAS